MLYCHKNVISDKFKKDQDDHDTIKEWKARNEMVKMPEKLQEYWNSKDKHKDASDLLKDGVLTMEEVMKLKTTKVNNKRANAKAGEEDKDEKQGKAGKKRAQPVDYVPH